MSVEKNYKLIHGDCIDKMKSIKDRSIDLILVDPPYGVTARNKWDCAIPLDALWEQYNRIIKENGAIIFFSQGMFTAQLMISNAKAWRYNLIWEKTQPTGFLNANRMPLRNHEDICVFYKKLPTYNPQKSSGRTRKVSTVKHKESCRKTTNYGNYDFTDYDSTQRFPVSVLKFPKDTQKSALHPTQKPIALCEWLIKTYTNKGDCVLDSCMGSGSVGIAAIECERNFIGIEKDDVIFSVAKSRIETFLIRRT